MFLQKLQLGIIIIQKNYFVKKIMQGLFSFYSSYWGSHMDLSWFLTEDYGHLILQFRSLIKTIKEFVSIL